MSLKVHLDEERSVYVAVDSEEPVDNIWVFNSWDDALKRLPDVEYNGVVRNHEAEAVAKMAEYGFVRQSRAVAHLLDENTSLKQRVAALEARI